MSVFFLRKLDSLSRSNPMVRAAVSAIHFGANPDEIMVSLVEQLVAANEDLRQRLLHQCRVSVMQPVIFPSYPKE